MKIVETVLDSHLKPLAPHVAASSLVSTVNPVAPPGGWDVHCPEEEEAQQGPLV